MEVVRIGSHDASAPCEACGVCWTGRACQECRPSPHSSSHHRSQPRVSVDICHVFANSSFRQGTRPRKMHQRNAQSLFGRHGILALSISAAEDFARADSRRPTAQILTLATTTALRKKEGDVRGIFQTVGGQNIGQAMQHRSQRHMCAVPVCIVDARKRRLRRTLG